MNMNYDEFLNYKKKLLEKQNYLINFSENNLYDYYPSKIKYDGSGHINGVVYRCHLVEDWLNYYGLEQELKKHIGVSNGVRHSIETLANKFKEKKFLIPEDVYPFYQKTLKNKNIKFEEYTTLGVKTLFNEIINKQADIMLLTDPLKPLGRDIFEKEYKKIEEWLIADKSRLLIVDGVYTLHNRLNNNILKLYRETNQVILLYSLSKAWCLPNHFGVSILPQNSIGQELREEYKLLEKNQEKLNYAYMALNKYKDTPHRLKTLLKEKREELEEFFIFNLPKSEDNPSYLFYSERSFEDCLKDGILVIPASVFGGKRGSVYSILV